MKRSVLIFMAYAVTINICFGQDIISEKFKDSIILSASNKIFNDSLYDAKEILEYGIRLGLKANDSIFLGDCYLNYGNLFTNLKDFDTALKYYHRSKDYYPTKFKDLTVKTALNISIIHQEKKEYEKSDSILHHVIKESRINSISVYFYAQNSLVENYLRRGLYIKAVNVSSRVLDEMDTFYFDEKTIKFENYIKTTLRALLQIAQTYAMIKLNYPKDTVYPKLITAENNGLKYLDWGRDQTLGNFTNIRPNIMHITKMIWIPFSIISICLINITKKTSK